MTKFFFSLLVATVVSTSTHAQSRTAVPSLESQRRSASNDHLGCQESTWCPQGYKIWCYEEGETCYSDSSYGEWVWCAGYDEHGHSWESSDYCY